MRYYVNRHTDHQGDHEVHQEGCEHFPDPDNAVYLGEFVDCVPAVAEAKRRYPTADGCFYCSLECHTS